MLSLALAGVVYGNWLTMLTFKSEIGTGVLEYGPIQNLQVVYLGSTEYTTPIPVSYDDNMISINLSTFDINQYEGFQITYQLAPSERNTITQIQGSVTHNLINITPVENVGFNLSFIGTSYIDVSGETINVTQTFSLSDTSKIAYANYIGEITEKVEESTEEVNAKKAELTERINELLIIDSSVVDNLNWQQYLDGLVPQYSLGSQETDYEFHHNLKVEQDYHGSSNTSLLTYGLWNQSLLLSGTFRIQFTSLQENEEESKLSEFETILTDALIVAKEAAKKEEDLGENVEDENGIEIGVPEGESDVETETPVGEESDNAIESPVEEERDNAIESPVEEESDNTLESPVEEESDIETETPEEEESDIEAETPVGEESNIEVDAPEEEESNIEVETPVNEES